MAVFLSPSANVPVFTLSVNTWWRRSTFSKMNPEPAVAFGYWLGLELNQPSAASPSYSLPPSALESFAVSAGLMSFLKFTKRLLKMRAGPS